MNSHIKQWADDVLFHMQRVHDMAKVLAVTQAQRGAYGSVSSAPVDAIVDALVKKVKGETIDGVRLSLAITNTAKRNSTRAV